MKFKIAGYGEMKSKKAQLKIQQMAFMLIAVTLFLALVGMVALSFGISSLKNASNALEEKNAFLLVSKLSDSPEFSCGKAFENQRINCVDSDKAIILKNRISKYGNFWGVSSIELRKIYPPSNTDIDCNLENYPECNKIEILKGTAKASFSNFVALCRKESSTNGIENKCELAKLIVGYDG